MQISGVGDSMRWLGAASRERIEAGVLYLIEVRNYREGDEKLQRDIEPIPGGLRLLHEKI